MRIAKTFCAVVLLVLIAGCPPQSNDQPQPGLWLFYINGDSFTLGLRILPDGQTQTLDPMNLGNEPDAAFEGLFTWSQSSGDIIIVRDDLLGHEIAYVGKVLNGTAMTGTFVQTAGPGFGTGFWSAVWVNN